MQRYIAFLRGINLGKRRLLDAADDRFCLVDSQALETPRRHRFRLFAIRDSGSSGVVAKEVMKGRPRVTYTFVVGVRLDLLT